MREIRIVGERDVSHQWVRLGTTAILLLCVCLTTAADTPSAGSAPPAPAGWVTEYPDPPQAIDYMTDRSMRLDGLGQPHFVYGGSHLFYAGYDGATSHFEVADISENVGSHAALAFDGDHQPHISYRDDANGDLKYAHLDAAGWHTSPIDSAGNVGEFTSIAVDGAGYPHISYYDRGNGHLKYAYMDAGGWHRATVDSGTDVGRHTSLALDGDGYPHIGYYDKGQGNLKYAFQDAGGWHTETVDSDGTVGKYASLALDSAGDAHLSYFDVGRGNLKVAHQDAGGWQVITVDNEGRVGLYTSIGVDDGGHPHISYADDQDWLKHAHLDAGGWHIEIVSDLEDYFAENIVRYTSLDLDSDGEPHIGSPGIIFNDWEPELALAYALRHKNSWRYEPLYVIGGGGAWRLSLALDRQGYPHASYHVGTWESEDIRYAYRDSHGWHVQVVVRIDGCVCVDPDYVPTSLAVDMQGYTHIAYRGDCIDWKLRYTHQDSGGWQTMQLSGDWDPFLVLDSSDYPHVVSTVWGENGLVGAHDYKDADGWHEEYLGFSGPTALDEADYLHIAFARDDGAELRYAYQDAAGWHHETADSSGGHPHSLVLDGDGYPHVTYEQGNNLWYALKDAAGWHRTTVGRAEYCRSSLDLDSNDHPHIVYSARDEDEVHYIYESDAGWQGPVVFAGGCDTVLKLNEAGEPYLAYRGDKGLAVSYPATALQADLVISKSVTPVTVGRGQPISYTLTFSNTGGSVAPSAILSDRVPTELTGVRFESSGPITPTGIFSYTWALGDLDPGDGGWIHLYGTVRGDLGAGFSFTNTACIGSTATDANLEDNCDSASATVINTAPVARDDTYITQQDTPLSTAPQSVLDNDDDAEGDALTALLETRPVGGILALSLDGTFVYSPTLGFSGEDAFTYRASDGLRASNVATATLTVLPIHHLYLPLVLRDGQ